MSGMNSEKERLLCYSAGIIGSTLSNPSCGYVTGKIPDWMINNAIESAQRLIKTISDLEFKSC